MNVYRKPSKLKEKNPFQNYGLLLLISAIVGIFIVAQWKDVDFLEQGKEGEPILSGKRQKELDKEIERLNNAEQYALIAIENDYFPCYNCPNDTLIFLYIGEVWRYGITINGEKGRYPNGLPYKALLYEVQVRGTLQECLIEEKRKIFNYATLPENIKRKIPLIRPPGNKQDR